MSQFVSEKQINPRFASHLLNDVGVSKAKRIAILFDVLLGDLKTGLIAEVGDGRDSREFMVALDKLEEAAFFAKKAMATQKENQKENV